MNVVTTTMTREPIFVGRDRAAEMLSVSTRTIDDAIRAKELLAYKIGRRVLIKREDLVAFAERLNA